MYKKTTVFPCSEQSRLLAKFFQIMRLSLILLLLGLMQVSAASYGQGISIKKNNVLLEEVFTDIRKQSNYNIFYNASMIAKAGKVSVSFNSLPIHQAMRMCLEGKNLTFKIVEKNIIISALGEKRTDLQKVDLTIMGKVTDETGGPLVGATVKIKATNRSVVTNSDGNYKIIVPDTEAVLVFSYLGYVSQERKVGKNTKIDIALKPLKNDLSEVVVTALNIKREEKSLGYSLTTINGNQLNDAISNNWTDALSGKVAGLNLLRSNGGPAGSNRIILRGENSLSGTTEALIVLDGVVISSSSGRATGNGQSYMGDDSPTDYGTSINDINPADIESVSVLKGPGATALYGARGAGGAIIITTKLADPKAKGVGVSINSNSAFESPSRWPDYQNEYGQGDVGLNYYSYSNSADGLSTRATSSAWGPKFDGQQFFQYDPNTFGAATTRTPWVAYPDNKKDFFQTGQTYTNNVSLEGGTRTTSARLSYTNVINTWIIPNTGYERNTLAFSLNQKITEKLQISAKASYTNKFSDNLPSVGYNNQTIMYWVTRQMPNVNLDWLKDYWVPGGENVVQNKPYASGVDNPYLITYQMLNKSSRNTVTGNIQATYAFSPSLSLLIRTSMDMSYDGRSQQRPFSTNKYREGMYRTQNIFNQEINADFLLKYKKTLSKFIGADFSIGGSTLKNKYQNDEIRAERLFSPGIFNFANSKDIPLAFSNRANFGVTSLYGLATFSFDKFIYLDLTGRQDWSSTLVAEDGKVRGFFYPSANLSVVLSDKIKLPASISLLKLRGSYANVGSGGTTPYLTSYVYQSETNFPSGLTNPNSIANANLRPESTTSIEFGTDIRLFSGRIGADVSIYQNNTKDQILRVPLDRSSGYYYSVLNSGEVRNRGLEVALNGNPIKGTRGRFNWNVTATFAINRNKVLSLADSVETLVLQSGPGSRGSIEAHVGGNMGDLYGLGYQRAPDGQIIYEGGYPLRTQTSRYLANIYPKWKGSIGNEFRYKQFRLNVLFDAQFGGKGYSHTHANNAQAGKLNSTIPGRYNGIIGDGVIANGDGTYRKNDVVSPEIWSYYLEHFTPENIESNIFRTDFIIFREARIDYTFTSKLVKRLGLQRATIGVYGRDLFILTNWPSFDPEFGTINNGLIQSGFEIGQFPSTRTMGVNLNLAF